MTGERDHGGAGDALTRLLVEIKACRICESATARAPLPHRARPVVRLSTTARVLIAGQAPGARVHASGVPFDDPSGERLRAWMGVQRHEFYDETRIAILPMGFCFPGHDAKGGDLPPRPECAARWRHEALAHVPAIELVLLIGQYAQRWHLGRARGPSLSATVADWRSHGLGAERIAGRPLMVPLPHPSWRNTSWLKRHPWFEAELLPALRHEVRRVLDR